MNLQDIGAAHEVGVRLGGGLLAAGDGQDHQAGSQDHVTGGEDLFRAGHGVPDLEGGILAAGEAGGDNDEVDRQRFFTLRGIENGLAKFAVLAAGQGVEGRLEAADVPAKLGLTFDMGVVQFGRIVGGGLADELGQALAALAQGGGDAVRGRVPAPMMVTRLSLAERGEGVPTSKWRWVWMR